MVILSSLSLGVAPWASNKLAMAIRTMELHGHTAILAECTFIAANKRPATVFEDFCTAKALTMHFQTHCCRVLTQVLPMHELKS